MNNIQIICYSW